MTERGKIILVVFLVCGIGDFAWGYFNQRSIAEGLLWAFLGLFGTTLFVAFWNWRNGE